MSLEEAASGHPDASSSVQEAQHLGSSTVQLSLCWHILSPEASRWIPTGLGPRPTRNTESAEGVKMNSSLTGQVGRMERRTAERVGKERGGRVPLAEEQTKGLGLVAQAFIPALSTHSVEADGSL